MAVPLANDSKEKIEEVEHVLHNSLDSNTVKFRRNCPGGMVNQTCVFTTDSGDVFVKFNHKQQAREIFDGEIASLTELLKTGVLKVPKPIKVLDLPSGGAALAMEYLEMAALSGPELYSKLGQKIAQLHKHNERRRQKTKTQSVHHTVEDQEYVDKFGFHTPTPCGLIVQDTVWTDSWLEYWARKMEKQISLLQSNYGEREIVEQWRNLELRLPTFFRDIEVKPCLLHADLWEENLGISDGEVVIFDPGCFYGHSEFDLSMPSLCTGPDWKMFFTSYHSIIPKTKGFCKRRKLYQLYHHVNHWNHFGPSSEGEEKRQDRCLTLATLQDLLLV